LSWHDKKSIAAPALPTDVFHHIKMCGPTWIWVVFWLVFLSTPGIASTAFAPLPTPIALPDNLRGHAVWTIVRLPDGNLAAGFEGGVALGVPGGAWTIVPAPNGGPLPIVAPAHGRILVAGSSCSGFVESGTFIPVPGLQAQFTSAQAVPEGWLLAGPTGLWLVEPAGNPTPLTTDGTAGHPVLGLAGHEVHVLWPGHAPLRWTGGALIPATLPQAPFPRSPRLLRDDLWFDNTGVFADSAEPVLPHAVAAALLDEAWLINATRGTPWILCATYRHGIAAYRPGATTPDWQWTGPGACLALNRDGGAFLLGTTSGAFALADPNRVLAAPLDNADILHIRAEPAGARLVTLAGVLDFDTPSPSAGDALWPETGGATVVSGTLHFRGNAFPLATQYVNGLSTCGDSAAVAYGNTLFVATSASPVLATLPSGIDSLASDGRAFFAGTYANGVHAFAPDGRAIACLGQGRSKVREVAPGRPLLLFWHGEVRDTLDTLLGTLPYGNPRDAALASVRRGDGTVANGQLVVLATRADAPPILGLLADGAWTPLDVPGLAEIDAEAVAANNTFLYVAGRRGIIEVRLPLTPASAPVPSWSWAGAGQTLQLDLPDETTAQAVLTPGRWEPSVESCTRYRVRPPHGDWIAAQPGLGLGITVNWGHNTVVLQAERNGLVTERTLIVVRPHPWFLRPWALGCEAIALAAVVWGLARWRLRHLLRQKRALEQAVERRTAELRKANAAKEEFLASVSHEIRNPLNGVVGICAILDDSPVGPRERSFVRILSGCAQQLHSMLDDVLDFSRIDRGEIALACAPVEVGALVEESVRVMDPALEACSLHLPDTPAWLDGDAGKIRQIVCNLVSNALKYGRPREASVELRLSPTSDGRVHLHIAVRNPGPTIPADELPRLFESFRRGAGTDNVPGFGLGLAVCRRLAERMGGRMTATSAAGTTEFALDLVLPGASAPAARDTAPTPVSRALAVEDEDYNRLALGHALRALGYETDWATDGASALQLARRQPYDLVLTDWKLPDIDGDELCRRLLAVLAPPCPPIVAVTAYSSAEKMAAATAAGMAGFVTKPITREKLERLIRNLDTGPRPRPAIDTPRPAAVPSALSVLGDLAPTLAKLSADLDAGWRQAEAQTRLRDPRAGRAAHALRSLILLAGQENLAEQLGLLERAASESEWATADRLLPFLDEEISTARRRLAEAAGS
jgi:signal transduction histidine kinase/CheY-like chemotaxis protein